MELVVAEKPKVAQKIATAICKNLQRKIYNNIPYYHGERNGKEIIVASAVGHVYALVERERTKSYPVFDVVWAPAYKASKGAAYTKQYIALREELGKKADIFVSACDYDIEGSTIAYNVFRFATKIREGRRMK
ncbi:MAG: toprim domain-containing protein, partial [Candidatus Bilamarchaeaceae archaeon]